MGLGKALLAMSLSVIAGLAVNGFLGREGLSGAYADCSPGVHTKMDYLEFLRRAFPVGGGGMWGPGIELLLGEVLGDEEDHWARAAEQIEQSNGVYFWATCDAFRRLREANALSPEAEARAKDLLLKFGKQAVEADWNDAGMRTFNLALSAALSCEYLCRLFPEAQTAKEAKRFADEVWREWWSVRDNMEDSANYGPITMNTLILWAELRGEEERFYSDHIVRGMFERYLQQLTPLGIEPDYGDCSWANQFAWWIALFEKAASEYKDGRFKWAAHRILDYAERSQMYGPNVFTLYFLTWAYRWADDSVHPQEPKSGSLITYRYLPNSLGFGPGWAQTNFRQIETGERRQDKLVLRGGWQQDDPYLLVGLTASLQHGHVETTAILNYICNGAVLLHDTGYRQHWPEYHNLLFAQQDDDRFPRYSTPSFQEDREHWTFWASVDALLDLSEVVIASLRSEKHLGYPLDLRRTVLLHKREGWVVVDDVVRISAGQYRLGPLYHVQQVISKGGNYFQVAAPSLADHDTGREIPNRPARFLIQFPLQQGEVSRRRLLTPREVEGRPDDLAKVFLQRNCLYQVCRGEAGQRKEFVSLLIPLLPSEEAAGVATEAQVLSGEVGSVCLQARGATVGFCQAEKIQNRLLETDAKVIYLKDDEARTSACFLNATRLIWEGVRLLESLGRCDFEGRLISGSPRESVSGEINVSSRRVTGVLYSGIRAAVAIHVPAQPTSFEVNGRPLRPDYDADREVCRLVVYGETQFTIGI